MPPKRSTLHAAAERRSVGGKTAGGRGDRVPNTVRAFASRAAFACVVGGSACTHAAPCTRMAGVVVTRTSGIAHSQRGSRRLTEEQPGEECRRSCCKRPRCR